MTLISLKDFQTKKKNGVYVFHSYGCFTCEEHINTMEEEIHHFYLLECSQDIDYFESLDITLTPCTIVYKNDVELWRKQGAFYTLQLDELRQYL